MPITPEDNQQYEDFVKQQLITLGCADYDREQMIVWHYTRGPGLLGILESGTIYATQAACLNDSTEIRYALKIFKDSLVELQPKYGGDTDEGKLLAKLIEMYEDNPAIPSHAPSRFFVACFSRLEDDLNQWRVYGEQGGENGYAIGFQARGLYDPNGALLKVSYDKDVHKVVASRVAEATVRFYSEGIQKKRADTVEQWTTEFLVAWDEWIARLAPVVKDDCFRAEEEFRLVHELNSSEFYKIKFQQKETLLSRSLPVGFPGWVRHKYPMLPLAKILIGPGRQQHITRVSVSALLTQLGYTDIPIELSRRPLQLP